MNANYARIAKTVMVLLFSYMLSGCFSIMLAVNSKPGRQLKEWKSDTVTGLSLAQDRAGTQGYVFIGKGFDYLLTSGVDSIVNLLKSPDIDRHDLQVSNVAKFIIDNDKKQFTGDLTLQYRWKTQEAKQTAIRYGFACSASLCLQKLSGLKGSVHQKNNQQDYSQALVFYHPFKVAFYQYKRTGMPAGVTNALIPVALTLDIVTSPVQLLGIGIITGLTGS
ncbi:YidX family protein [Intestinirhabdus alba]|jgi:hypothetical protein|uniref:Lipoprotein n=1 Tax=Intestinirhabdus alba TaxID=2899544 RepID=A0A6L6ISU0_9ENTR|nr:hypothetical protein [Intestinirhabdus alba]MTH47833.1 hypothetical protein [Intestinirhabdus alba]